MATRKHISMKGPIYLLVFTAGMAAGVNMESFFRQAEASTPQCKKGSVMAAGIGPVEVTACLKGGKYYLSP